MNIKTITVVLLIVVSSSGLSGQSINSTQFPSEIRWKQIETENCILIFPEELQQKAYAIAARLDSLYPPVEASLGTEVTKWPIILNNSLLTSNGYVTGAPKHAQLYTLPPQDGWSGTTDWLSFLWSHELRHIVQNEKMKRGFTEIASWLTGEYGWSGMSHFALPRLFWEGDAVITETLLSESGRGRLPDFERGLRTNLLSGIRYDYNKSALGNYGSYDDNVQSWYVTGYHFCTYLRKEYGIEAFNRILEISADFSFTPLIVNIAVKNVTGKNIDVLYEECMDELTGLWRKQLEKTPVTDAVIIRTGKKNDVTSYYPLGTSRATGNITALKTSSAHKYQLIELMPDGSNKILKTINPSDRNVSFNGSAFCWSEQQKDIRWGNSSWSVIRLFVPETGEYRLLTDKTRYFAPSLSPDGSMITAIEYNRDLESAIVIIDRQTGKLKKRFPEPAGASALQPCWSEDGTSIIFIRQQDNRKSLHLIEYPMGREIRLTEAGRADIAGPAAGDGWIYYVTSKSGVDQINAVSLSGKQIFEAVSTPFGAASPVLDGSRILFSDYTQWGWALAEAEIDRDKWRPGSELINTHVDYFADIAEQEPFAGFLELDNSAAKIKKADYEVEDYSPFFGIFNIHSTGLGLTNSGTGIKLYLQADDILNYSSNQIYAGWDPQNGEFVTGLAGAWAGFLPILLYGAELNTPEAMPASMVGSSLYGGAALPLNFSEGILEHYLTLQSVFFMETSLTETSEPQTAVNSTLSWHYTELMARKDIMPPSGMSLKGRWYYSMNPRIYNFASGEAVFYLPGLLENHGLSLELEAEYNIDSSLLNMSPQKLPRGISSTGLSYPFLLNTSLNYSLPVGYPDFSLGGFLYIPRVYMNIFCDAAAGLHNPGLMFSDPELELMLTAGFEVYADFHLFNNIVPLKTGLRVVYDFQSGVIRLEDTVLLLGISLP
ncbi:MAG: hypothetical protein JEZ04_12210 [Spirochaetales bacterium]|nr:hypothetical protein [Spirochaetales bacterium]